MGIRCGIVSQGPVLIVIQIMVIAVLQRGDEEDTKRRRK